MRRALLPVFALAILAASVGKRTPEILEQGLADARRLLRELGELDSYDLTTRAARFRELLAHADDGAWIELPFLCEYGRHISIGKDTFVNTNCVFSDCNRITVGDHVLIGPNCQLYTALHPVLASERVVAAAPGQAPYRTQSKPIRIGNKVWMGGSVIVLPGVTIGDGTTIGAGSVVTKDIPANVLAYGNPCRIVRELT